MSREEHDKLMKSGFWVSNDSLKDIAEDVSDIFEDVEDMLKLDDKRRPINMEAVKKDAAVRYSAPVQKLLKMVLKDFGIKDMKDARTAERAVEHFVEDLVDTHPYFARLRKAAERLVRFYARAIEIDDLPKDKRMRIVNMIAERLHWILKKKEVDPGRGLRDYVEQSVHDVERNLERWMGKFERLEHKYKKNKDDI